jgi:hypothetical protein
MPVSRTSDTDGSCSCRSLQWLAPCSPMLMLAGGGRRGGGRGGGLVVLVVLLLLLLNLVLVRRGGGGTAAKAVPDDRHELSLRPECGVRASQAETSSRTEVLPAGTRVLVQVLQSNRRGVPAYDGVSACILGHTATQSTSTLPASWRVLLLQGLVTKSEYNGKRACVCFFDDQAGRYTVKVEDDGRRLRLKPKPGRYTVELDDDGRRLSLKPEFVVPDKTDQPSLAVRALRNFAHRLDAPALSFGLCLARSRHSRPARS